MARDPREYYSITRKHSETIRTFNEGLLVEDFSRPIASLLTQIARAHWEWMEGDPPEQARLEQEQLNPAIAKINQLRPDLDPYFLVNALIAFDESVGVDLFA
jgi:hypothetical protein